jgi:hypothetical protein
MRRSSNRLIVLILAAFFLSVLGSGGCKDKKPEEDAALSPAEYFKKHQGSTVTPNGKILMDSVQAAGEKIQYKTDDGKTWRVGYSKRADGTYEYQTPDEVKEP